MSWCPSPHHDLEAPSVQNHSGSTPIRRRRRPQASVGSGLGSNPIFPTVVIEFEADAPPSDERRGHTEVNSSQPTATFESRSREVRSCVDTPIERSAMSQTKKLFFDSTVSSISRLLRSVLLSSSWYHPHYGVLGRSANARTTRTEPLPRRPNSFLNNVSSSSSRSKSHTDPTRRIFAAPTASKSATIDRRTPFGIAPTYRPTSETGCIPVLLCARTVPGCDVGLLQDCRRSRYRIGARRYPCVSSYVSRSFSSGASAFCSAAKRRPW